MFSDKEDDFHRSKRLSLPAFVHEWALLHVRELLLFATVEWNGFWLCSETSPSQHGTLKKAELEVLEIVTAARHFKSDRRVHLFARMCHAFGSENEKESPLPLEGLNFGLDVLFYLHETAAQTVNTPQFCLWEAIKRWQLISCRWSRQPTNQRARCCQMLTSSRPSRTISQTRQISSSTLTTRLVLPKFRTLCTPQAVQHIM